MRAVVATEGRFFGGSEGSIWTKVAFTPSFWARYLAHFDAVLVVARVTNSGAPPAGSVRVDSPRVSFLALPDYRGPAQYLRRHREVRARLAEVARLGDAFILRLPGWIGETLAGVLHSRAVPYAIELVGDPYDVFGPGAVRHPLRPLLRTWWPWRLRRHCARASGVAYVTDGALQQRYPASEHAFTASYSNVELTEQCFSGVSHAAPTSLPTIVTVGSMAQPYKGVDVLVDAVALAAQRGVQANLNVVGDGHYRAELEERARQRGLSGRVRFMGELPAGDAVRRALDEADIFVLASRTEGLPRSMLEAMARGLPCIGTAVGGIPQLLPSDSLVPPGDAEALADRLVKALKDPSRLKQMSSESLHQARGYADAKLAVQRDRFYQQLRQTSTGAGAVHRAAAR